MRYSDVRNVMYSVIFYLHKKPALFGWLNFFIIV